MLLGTRLPRAMQCLPTAQRLHTKFSLRASLFQSRVPSQRMQTMSATPAAYQQPASLFDQQPTMRATAQFTLYKSRGAVRAKVISPTWKSVADRTGSSMYTVAKEGVLLLEFAAASADSGSAPGERRYEWTQKQTFALSPLELGYFLDPPKDAPVNMFHDPSKIKGYSAQAKTTKSLQLSANPQKVGDWFLNITAKTGESSSKITVAIQRQEFAVFQALIKDLLPHLYGFDQVKMNGLTELSTHQTNGVPTASPF